VAIGRGMSTDDETDREKIRRYRSMADECRARAAEMHYPEARAGLKKVAQSFDIIADFIETKISGNTPSQSI
jgi:hypothetical protein